MGVDEGGLQVVDIEMIILLYVTYSPAALIVFVIHTISHNTIILVAPVVQK